MRAVSYPIRLFCKTRPCQETQVHGTTCVLLRRKTHAVLEVETPPIVSLGMNINYVVSKPRMIALARTSSSFLN
jgi:hypothetical protein